MSKRGIVLTKDSRQSQNDGVFIMLEFLSEKLALITIEMDIKGKIRIKEVWRQIE